MEVNYEKIIREGYELGETLELLAGISFEEFKTEVEKKFKPNIKELAEKYENSRDEDLLERDKEINSWYRETKDTEYYLRVVVRQAIFKFAVQNKKVIKVNIHGFTYNGINLVYAEILGDMKRIFNFIISSGVKYEIKWDNALLNTVDVEVNNKRFSYEVDLYKPLYFFKCIEDEFTSQFTDFKFVEFYLTYSYRIFLLLPRKYIEKYKDNIFFPYQYNNFEFPHMEIHPFMIDIWSKVYTFGKELGLLNNMNYEEFLDRVDKIRVEHLVREIQGSWYKTRKEIYQSGNIKKIQREEFIAHYTREIMAYRELLKLAREEKNIIVFPKDWNIKTVIDQIKDLNSESTIKLLTTNNFVNGKMFIELEVDNHIEKAEIEQKNPKTFFNLINKNQQDYQYLHIDKKSNTYKFVRIKKDKVNLLKDNMFIR